MKTMNRFKYFVILILLISPVKISQAEEKSGYDIQFANTFFIEHFSDVLYNDVRTEHKTIADRPSFNFNEKLQIFFIYPEEPLSCTRLLGCIFKPSFDYLSINVVYTHYENFAIRTGIGLELGYGSYRNPFLCYGFELCYLNDMVFRYSKYSDLNLFFKIGHQDNMHFYLNFSGPLNDTGVDNIYRSYFDIDTALGYKKFLPLFLRFNAFITENDQKIDDLTNTNYSYYHEVYFTHLQYYGDHYGISIGYIYNKELYEKTTYNENRTKIENSTKLDYRKSHGGGLTFYANNSDSSAELFGEFHLLADKDMNWMTISKLGVKAYF